MTTHCMLDLETFGTAPGCALRSLGAVIFSFNGSVLGEYYANIDRQSCLDAGLIINPETEAWWAKQSAEARAALDENPRPLLEVANEFHKFFRQFGASCVWSQGANFDEPIWQAVCRQLGLIAPWKYWAVRDTRTAYDLFDFDPRIMLRTGNHHNALDDARHQAWCVIEASRRRGLAAP